MEKNNTLYLSTTGTLTGPSEALFSEGISSKYWINAGPRNHGHTSSDTTSLRKAPVNPDTGIK